MSVARSYARALYEAAADGPARDAVFFDGLQSQLGEFVSMVLSSDDLRTLLFGPLVSAKEKVGIIEQLGSRMKLEAILVRFLSLLAQKGRLPLLSQIQQAFAAARLAAEGGVAGSLVAADVMDPADVDGLAKAFSQKLGRKVAFQVSTDPSLLAGMKVTVSGVTYDGTLRSQLQQLRDRFLTGQTAQ